MIKVSRNNEQYWISANGDLFSIRAASDLPSDICAEDKAAIMAQIHRLNSPIRSPAFKVAALASVSVVVLAACLLCARSPEVQPVSASAASEPAQQEYAACGIGAAMSEPMSAPNGEAQVYPDPLDSESFKALQGLHKAISDELVLRSPSDTAKHNNAPEPAIPSFEFGY